MHIRGYAAAWLKTLPSQSCLRIRKVRFPSLPTIHTAIAGCRVFDRLSAVSSTAVNRGGRLISPSRMGAICSRRRRIESGTQTSAPDAEASRVRLRRKDSIPREKFVTAIRRVINLLRLRRKWAAYGRILQQYPRSDLWTGLERRRGVLYRLQPAWVHKEPWRAAGHHRQSRMTEARTASSTRRRRNPIPKPQSDPRTANARNWQGRG